MVSVNQLRTELRSVEVMVGHYKVSSTQLICSRESYNNHGSLLLRYTGSGQDGKGGGQYLADTMNGSQ